MNEQTILKDIKTVLAGINGRVLDGAMVTEDEQRFVLAVQRLDQFVADVETEVCPDWSKAPEWAQWWAVDALGDDYGRNHAFWYARAPRCFVGIGEWATWAGSLQRRAEATTLPIGYDWRLSLQKRPD